MSMSVCVCVSACVSVYVKSLAFSLKDAIVCCIATAAHFCSQSGGTAFLYLFKKKKSFQTFSLFQKLRVSMTFISPYLRDRFIKALQSVKCAHYTTAKGALLRGVAAEGRR